MFSLLVEDEMLSLIFSNENLRITCYPEDSTNLKKNGFDSRPSNGEFNFVYNEEKIVFECSKYGDGRGGYLLVELKMNKEIKESLERALEEWKNFNIIDLSNKIEEIIDLTEE